MKVPAVKLPKLRRSKPEVKPKPRRSPKAKLPKLTGSWPLIKQAVPEALADWKPYLLILAVVTVPVDLMSVLPQFASDPTASSFASFAAITMNVALIWAILRRHETGRVPKLGEAYYDSSIALVRFLLVTVALVVMLIPAGLGAALFSAALSGSSTGGVPAAEVLLVGLVSLVLASPSIYLMVRYALSPLLVVRDGLRPVAALRAARRLTLGRFWPLFGRYFMLGIYIALLSIPVSLVVAVFAFLKLTNTATFVFEVLSTIVALPIFDIYVIRLAESLEAPAPEPEPESAAA